MSRARPLALDWLLFPLLMALAGLIVYGALILPGFPHWGIAQIQGETRSFHYPTLCYISDALRAAAASLVGGRPDLDFFDLLPLWNPYQDAGFPLFCDANAQLWFPATWLISLTVGYSFHVLQAQLWATFVAAGIGGYAWGRSLGLRRTPAFALGVGYMACGAVAASASSLSVATGWAGFPFVLALNQRAQTPGGWRSAVASGLILGVTALGAHPGLTCLLILNLVVYNILLFILRRQARRRRWRVAAWRAALTLCVYFGISAVQWLPSLWHAGELTGGRLPFSTVVDYRPPEPDELGAIISAVAAGISIENIERPPSREGPLRLWISLTLMMGALLAWARRKRAAQATVLLLFYLFNVLLALGAGSFLAPLAYNLVPGYARFLHFSTWFRGFSMLALVTLGAMGLDNLLALPRRQIAAWSAPAAAAVAAGVCAAGTALAALSGWAAIRGFGPAEWQWLEEMWVSFLFAAGAGALLLLMMTGRIATRLFAFLAVGCVVAECGTLAWRGLPLFAEPLSPANGQIAGQLEVARETGFPTPLAMRRTPGAQNADDPNLAWLRKTPAMLSAGTRKLTRYVRLLQPGDSEWMSQRDYLFSLGEGDPRAAFAYQFEMAGSPDHAFDLLAARPQGRIENPVVEISADEGYDWRAKLQSSGAAGSSSRPTARLDRYAPCRAVIQTENPQAAVVIFNDAWFSGWQARLEGARTPSHPANGLFRAVFIPPGPHRLEFVFRPVSVWVGWAISLLCALASGLALLVPRKNLLEQNGAESR